MIESIEFTNFKALRNTTLRLAPFTLLLGPNGSGKSSVLQALQGIASIVKYFGLGLSGSGSNVWKATPSAMDPSSPVQIRIRLESKDYRGSVTCSWEPKSQSVNVDSDVRLTSGAAANSSMVDFVRIWMSNIQTYALDPISIASHAQVNSGPLGWNGGGLAAVMDDLKDNFPENWESLIAELREWLPEYDHIQFTKPQNGHKAIALRTKRGHHQIPASELSQGTLVALALLTLAHLPNPPSLIGLEEIDRGLHPRLLRHLQDALYRLSYPEASGEKRPAIQIIATTHSPYLLDLYREHPEEIVLAQKEGLEVQFKQLSKVDHFKEILGDALFSEVWYSGVLGGVSVKP